MYGVEKGCKNKSLSTVANTVLRQIAKISRYDLYVGFGPR